MSTRPAADPARAKALFNLGVCFARGEGVAQDWTEAVRYFRAAAEQGHAAAQYNLGVRFERGEGVAQDWAEAVRYYRLAAARQGALCLSSDSDGLSWIIAALDRIACSREAASACCLGCGSRRKLKICAKCQVARFCSTECVARAWPAHKPHCKIWRGDGGA
jgi:hypothetical protein